MPTAAAIESDRVRKMLHRTVYFFKIMHTVAVLFTTVTYGSFSNYSMICNDAISNGIYLFFLKKKHL